MKKEVKKGVEAGAFETRKRREGWNVWKPLLWIFEERGGLAYDSVIVTDGDWLVSGEGDIYYLRPGAHCWLNAYDGVPSVLLRDCHAIWASRLGETGLIRELNGYEWFRGKQYEDFKRVYQVACLIADVVPMLQF